MTRKLALVVGVLLGSVPAASLLAQSTATKPNSSSGMQHTPTVAASQSTQDTASNKSAARAHHMKWTKDQIKEAQAGLAKAGYFKGEPNGVYSKQTRKAIRAYQKANNLPVTGRLDNELLAKLRTA